MTPSTTQAALAALSTATLSDSLDRLGLPGSVEGLGPVGPATSLAGPAFTVRYLPVGTEAGTVGDYVDDVPPGSVIVLDNRGRTDCTVWGDILTSVAHAREVAGTVIDGVCRDTARAVDLGYPIHSRGRFVRTGKDRVQASDIEAPVALGNVLVRPGDLVFGDRDAIVVVPADRAEQLLDVASNLSAAEDRILADALEGGDLRAARRRFGYHDLQRNERS